MLQKQYRSQAAQGSENLRPDIYFFDGAAFISG
jgi:hypothetical protein